MDDNFEEQFKGIVSNHLEEDDSHSTDMSLKEMAHILEQINVTGLITTQLVNALIENGDYDLPPQGAGLLRSLHYLCEEFCNMVIDHNDEEEELEEEEEEGGSED